MKMEVCHFCECPDTIYVPKGTPMLGWLETFFSGQGRKVEYRTFNYVPRYDGTGVPHPLSKDYFLCEEHKAMVRFA